jgi:hypothetical protein
LQNCWLTAVRAAKGYAVGEVGKSGHFCGSLAASILHS